MSRLLQRIVWTALPQSCVGRGDDRRLRLSVFVTPQILQDRLTREWRAWPRVVTEEVRFAVYFAAGDRGGVGPGISRWFYESSRSPDCRVTRAAPDPDGPLGISTGRAAWRVMFDRGTLAGVRGGVRVTPHSSHPDQLLGPGMCDEPIVGVRSPQALTEIERATVRQAGGLEDAGPGPGGGGGPDPAELERIAEVVTNKRQTIKIGPCTTEEIKKEFDFHQIVSVLGDYPALLRTLRLAIDLEVPYPPGQGDAIPTEGWVWVCPYLAAPLRPRDQGPQGEPETLNPSDVGRFQCFEGTEHQPVRTRYEIRPAVAPAPTGAEQPGAVAGGLPDAPPGDQLFLAAPAKRDDPRFAAGLVNLSADNGYRFVQLDLEGSAIKIKQMLRQPDASLAGAAPPALRSGGISLVNTRQVEELAAAVGRQVELARLGDRAGDYRLALAASAPAGGRGSAPLLAGDLGGDVAGGGGRPRERGGADDTVPWPALSAFLDDVIRGFRVDVRDAREGVWQSLNWRIGHYSFPGADHPPIRDLVDEGIVSLAVAVQDARAIVHDTVCTWNGWSLGAPRPGIELREAYAEQDRRIGLPNSEKLPVDVRFAPVAGTLPRLRFGRAYTMRLRVVDLAGNSLPAWAQGGAAAPGDLRIDYRRYECVTAPQMTFRADPAPGDSADALVLRSVGGPPNWRPPKAAPALPLGWRDTDERHVAPAPAPPALAERHGRFDALDPQLSYALIERREGALGHTEPARVPRLRYLPDPLATAARLRDVERQGADGRIDCLFPFGAERDWPEFRPFRIVLTGKRPVPVECDTAARTVTVYARPGESRRLSIAADLAAGQRDLLAMKDWGSNEIADPDIRRRVVEQLLAPPRAIRLVHAVRYPVEFAGVTLNGGDVSVRRLGDTTETLAGGLTYERASSGRVEIRAVWDEFIDDPGRGCDGWPARGTRVTRLLAPGQPGAPHEPFAMEPVGDGAIRTVTGPFELVHPFPDTRYRRVHYRAVATSRYRSYFFPPARDGEPAAPPPDDGSFTLERADRSDAFDAADLVRELPSTARPALPAVTFVVPAFGWDRPVGDSQSRSRTRRGGTLRVYMRRPWFSSGQGEKLGVVCLPDHLEQPDGAGQISEHADASLNPLVTRWGLDPIRDPVDLPSLYPRVGMFRGAAAYRGDGDKGYTLAELTPTGSPTQPERPLSPGGAPAGTQNPVPCDDADDRSRVPCDDEDRTPARPGNPAPAAAPNRAAQAGPQPAEARAKAADDVPRVYVAAYDVHPVPDTETASGDPLCYADIEFDVSAVPAYFPFVRLALCRFQPNSWAGSIIPAGDTAPVGIDVHLSPVARADFIQLPADRTATILRRTEQGEVLLDVSVSREAADTPAAPRNPRPPRDAVAEPAAHRGGDPANFATVTLERRLLDASAGHQWIAEEVVTRLQGNARERAHGTVSLGRPPEYDAQWAARFRLVVREYEQFAAADGSVVTRLVYADALMIPG